MDPGRHAVGESATVAEIRRGTTRLARRLRAERPAGALSATKVSVLGDLYREGERTPAQVAAAEHHHLQSLSRVLAALEQDGLIRRRVSEDDRRASVLALTDAGRAAIEGDMAARDRWLASALGELTATEIQLLSLAAGLMNRLADSTPSRP